MSDGEDRTDDGAGAWPWLSRASTWLWEACGRPRTDVETLLLSADERNKHVGEAVKRRVPTRNWVSLVDGSAGGSDFACSDQGSRWMQPLSQAQPVEGEAEQRLQAAARGRMC